MARRSHRQWHSFARPSLRRPGQQRPTKRQRHRRRLRFEPLEERRLLAVVNTLLDIVDPGDGLTSLREALTSIPGNVTFAASLTSGGPAVIQLTNVGHAGEIVINRNVTINGPGADLLTIQAFDPTPDMNNGDGSRIFKIDDGNFNTQRSVALGQLTLTGGDVSGYGGAILSQENLTITGCTISGNSAGSDGGGVYGGISSYVRTTITDCIISDNSAGADGGGIHSPFSLLELADSTIVDNTAQYGGGVYAGGGTIARSTISGNVASHFRGGLAFGGDVSDSRIEGNQATYGGGLSGGRMITNTVIYNNMASSDGGGVFGNQGTLVNCTISANRAGRDGGGLWGGGTSLDGCTLSFNTAVRNGGGIFGGGGQMVNTTVSGNSATNGGGLFLFNFGQFDLRHSTVVGNRTSGLPPAFGPGIFFANGLLKLDHSIVSNVLTFYGQSVEAHYSIVLYNEGSPLVEAPIGAPDANGNLIGGPIHGEIDALLGSLGDNGGLVYTHALLPGSPALNAGDLAAAPGVNGVPAVDGRGAPFSRIAGGRIDIGAHEEQSLPNGTLTVDTLVDEDDGHYGPGDLSLREAIHLAVGSVGPDTITFAPTLTASGPATINLTHGALGIGTSLSIIGPGADLLTIDASGNDYGSGVFVARGSNFPNGFDDLVEVAMAGLTITGADGSSGIESYRCNLTVSESRITGNSKPSRSHGDSPRGGGIEFSYGTLKIYDSTISDNLASLGGGIAVVRDCPSLEIHNSVISNNHSAHGGGGIWEYNINSWTITGSTVSNNSSNDGNGGGILTTSDLTVRASTISGNSVGDDNGGGISSDHSNANITVIDSTISGNRAPSLGGGIYTGGLIIARRSTIVGNIAFAGGGIWASQILLDHVIVASNSQNDLQGNVAPLFSLIGNGSGATIFDNGTNLIGSSLMPINPLLGPLADNGGPTLPDGSKMLTHALLPGSPAIDAGRPTAVAGAGGVPEFDQRGAPFTRVSGGRIDIGALEQPTPPALPGDYNQDNTVDAADYVVGRKMLGTSVAHYSSADGNGDGIVDQLDHAVWTAHFGQTLSPPAAGSGVAVGQAVPDDSEWRQAEPDLRTAGSGVAVGQAVPDDSERRQAEPDLHTAAPIRDGGSSLRNASRTANRASFGAGPALAASSRDDALAAWLASQRDVKKQPEESLAVKPWRNDNVIQVDDTNTGTIDQVFALLASG